MEMDLMREALSESLVDALTNFHLNCDVKGLSLITINAEKKQCIGFIPFV
jgi:hypothetical protein